MSSDSASSRRPGLSRGRFIAALAAVSLVRPGSLRGEGTEVVTDDRIRPDGGPLRVALIADCQFADADTPKGSDRRYLRSPQKLADAVSALAAERPHFAVHPGDLIDRDFRSFGVTLPVDFPGVVAWINGHNHAGSYTRVGATHSLNLKGMVETFDNTYALATFHNDRIAIRGYGREPSRTLRF